MEAAQKIIVVDDEKSICSNVEKILTKGNYEVVRAESADEALEKMAVDSFSLLISDIVMPGKNGLELLKMVKEQWPLTKAVMMTAYASTDTAVKDLYTLSAKLATDVASRVIRKELDTKEHERLIAESIEELRQLDDRGAARN